ncbi:MAG TPA: PKD domain-containing protein [Thermoplasmata archaeon]|nr:PKD domain-containing protein [Thermoplasmata archaeon]
MSTATHDASLLVPFASAQTGSVVPFTAQLPSSDGSPSNYVFNFGDGTNASQAGATADHVYSAPGQYLVSVAITAGGAQHDNFQALGTVTITASFTTANAAAQPGVSGMITANSSSTSSPTGVLSAGQYVTVAGVYTSAPTNPDYVEQSPTITASSTTDATISDASNTSSGASAKVTFSTTGTYQVSFSGSSKSVSTGTTVTQSYVFTVFVAPTGVHGGLKGAAAAKSPHSGSLVVYELSPGGSTSEDPALDYETVGYEPILNVYQTLVSYNGSQTGSNPGSFVPVIAACVPGSTTGANNCKTLFTSSLQSGYNYTFVISGSPQFYDPATKASWGVWPTDVMFSLARTMGYAVLPCFGCNNGWIVTQALLPAGNHSWDGDFHGARNNTPQNVYNSMTINGTDCPTAAMAAPYHGCVTFHANGAGLEWPYFLQLIGDGLGGSIVPCGWFSAPAQGAGIPYWTLGNVTGNGDHPCAAPGQTGDDGHTYGLAPTSSNLPMTGWDNWELDGSGTLGSYVGHVQYNMVGSGPYYMNQFNIAQSYALAANPAYSSNPECTWQGCMPQKGTFANSVSVTWETSQLPGEEAYQSGVADFASIPSTDTGLRLQLIQQGTIKTTTFPSLSIDFMPFDLAFNKVGAAKYTTNPITVPSDVFSYSGLRQFIVHAYPYATIQSTINTLDGIQYSFNYGGAIPQFMGNYYPTNISFPTGDPTTSASTVGGAAWWWAQVTTSTSPYYDPELASCTTASPCEFPLFGETGAPDLDERINLWAAEINTLSGGRLLASPLDINFIDLVINSLYSGPYQNAMPLYRLGWAPDYPDPTDYMVPLYYPDSSYTASDTVLEQLTQATFDSPSCHSSSDWTWWSTNVTQMHGVATDCQGAAYNAMITGMHAAAVMPTGSARVLAYTEVEQIANALALYAYTFQQNIVHGGAAWIDMTSINTNPTIGGGQDDTWYTIQGNGVAGSSS